MSNSWRAGKGGWHPEAQLSWQLVVGTRTWRLPFSGFYERAPLKCAEPCPHQPVSSPSWLPASDPAVAQSGQRGVARMDGPASTDASARTCRWGVAERRGRGQPG